MWYSRDTETPTSKGDSIVTESRVVAAVVAVAFTPFILILCFVAYAAAGGS
jgi:hypothetical protein